MYLMCSKRCRQMRCNIIYGVLLYVRPKASYYIFSKKVLLLCLRQDRLSGGDNLSVRLFVCPFVRLLLNL